VSVSRFHVPTAAPGARVVLDSHAARHAREVLRLRAGATVRLFDGEGLEFEGLLEEVSRRRVRVRIGGPLTPRPEPPLRIVLAPAALRGDRTDLVVQKATELGVAEIWPVVTARTDAAARPALLGSRQQRWERVAAGAAEQCGRAVVPRIAPTSTLDQLLRSPFEGVKVVLVETCTETGLKQLSSPPAGAVLLLVGPAGGWEPPEVESLRQAGFQPFGLGPRVLRAETAAIAAVALVQGLWGDLG
jgi:16S rRNA (uracil1498-N3)-methyltransferase